MDDPTRPTADFRCPAVYLIGAIAALLQLATLIGILIALSTLGPRPATVEEYFAIAQHSTIVAVLRGDFLSLVVIALYLGTIPALYMALRRINPVAIAFAALFTVIGVTLCFSTESTFSLLRLSDQFAAATTALDKAQTVAAARAAVATDMWNSSGGYVCGLLLQGSGVMISLVMLRSRDFSKITAYAGLLANAVDLGQHVVRPFISALPAFVAVLMGLFYFVWFPMMARDLLRIKHGVSFLSRPR